MAAVKGWPFGSGPRLACAACSGDHSKLQDLDGLQNTSGLSGPMMSVRLRDRLSVSVYAVRRGINVDDTYAIGRTGFYDCLVVSIYLVYRPEFVMIFLYFATVVNLQGKAGRGKSTMVLTRSGYKSASS